MVASVTDLLGNRFTIGLQPGNVNPDGLDGPLPALVESAAAREAPRQRWNCDEVAAAFLRFHHNCVSAHRLYAVTRRPGIPQR